jgi:hypothetical protein
MNRSNAMYVYQIGSKVKVNRPADTHWHDKIGSVTGHSTYHDTYMIQIEGEVDPCWFLESQLVPADLTNVTAAMEPSSDEVIADLTEQLYELSKEIETLRGENQINKDRADKILGWYRHDMEHWETTMRVAKDKHGWCDEGANEVIDRLNAGFIGGYEVDRYTQEFEVEVEISVNLSAMTTVTVEATSLEEAQNMVAENPEDFLDPTSELESVLHYGYPDIEVEVN